MTVLQFVDAHYASLCAISWSLIALAAVKFVLDTIVKINHSDNIAKLR